MKKYEPIVSCKYGKLADKVKLEPDFFTGFQPERRQEIVKKEAEFYHSITEPYSVDDQLDKYYIQVTAKDGYSIPVKVYMPKKRNEKIPALVFIHGGGFMTCSVAVSYTHLDVYKRQVLNCMNQIIIKSFCTLPL